LSIKSKHKKETAIQHYRVQVSQNTPIVTAIVALIKKVEARKPLANHRPAEFVSLFPQGTNFYIEARPPANLLNATPWHSTKIIY